MPKIDPYLPGCVVREKKKEGSGLLFITRKTGFARTLLTRKKTALEVFRMPYSWHGVTRRDEAVSWRGPRANWSKFCRHLTRRHPAEGPWQGDARLNGRQPAHCWCAGCSRAATLGTRAHRWSKQSEITASLEELPPESANFKQTLFKTKSFYAQLT